MTATRLALSRRVCFAAIAACAFANAAGADSPGACAATPADAWKLSREAVATKDAGKVMATLTPAYRTRNAVEYAVGASMVAELSGLSGEMSPKPGAAEKAKKAEKSLLAELDAILKKHGAPAIAEIGKPLLPKSQTPEVQARFAKVDHAAFARAMEAFFVKVEAAAKAAGVSSEGPPKLDELVVGMGSLDAPLGAATVTGDTAKAVAGSITMLFRKQNGCWLVDGRENVRPRDARAELESLRGILESSTDPAVLVGWFYLGELDREEGRPEAARENYSRYLRATDAIRDDPRVERLRAAIRGYGAGG